MSSQNKTQPTDVPPSEYIAQISNETRKRDAVTLLDIYQKITNEPPIMWGPSMIGFGQYHYKYASGHEGDFFKGGFAPRKANMVVYLMTGVEQYADKLNKMGPWKTGASCLYLGSFDKIDTDILRELIAEDYAKMTEKFG